jgi:hypothetical protein
MTVLTVIRFPFLLAPNQRIQLDQKNPVETTSNNTNSQTRYGNQKR